MKDPTVDIATDIAIDIISDIFKSSFKNIKEAGEWLKQWNRRRDFFGIAARRYANKIEQRYNLMRIFGMSNPVPLRNIYTRVNILNKITASHRATVLELEEYFDKDRRSFGMPYATEDGITVVNKLDKFIVLGKPGAGKTTFLKYIALQALDNKLTKKRIPIFIGLKDWSDTEHSLFDHIVQQFDICDFPDAKGFITRILETGDCVLLLDGFDEVSNRVDDVITEIRNFTDKYSRNKIILSCRIAAYSYCFEQFTDIEIADFKLGQIEAFINNWFGKGSLKAKLCWDKINDEKPIRELASRPLLLTMLCIAFDETMEFPANRSELYKEAIDALLKKWDASRSIKRDEIYRHLSNRRKESLFSRIAATTFDSNRYFISQNVLEKYIAEFIQHLPEAKEETIDIDSEAILKAIEAQHGLFVERAKGIYSFSHLSFQEYFTAKYIVDNAKKHTLENLVTNRLFEDRWREIFLITSGMLEEADDYLLLIKKTIDYSVTHRKIKTFFKVVSASLNDPDIELIFPQTVSGVYRHGMIFTFSLLLAREYLLVLDRVGKLPMNYPSSKARGSNNDLNMSFAYARDLIRDLKDEKSDLLDEVLRRAREYVIPIPENHRAISYENDPVVLNLFLSAKKRHPVLDTAFDLALEPDLAELTRFLTASNLLVRCLQSECYVSRKTRQSILDNIFDMGQISSAG